jgi:hypothetical protein
MSFLIMTSACSTTPIVYLKNPQTGQSTTCGPYKNNDSNAMAAAMQEKQCIQDYKEQGYIRAPSQS